MKLVVSIDAASATPPGVEQSDATFDAAMPLPLVSATKPV